MSNNHKRVSMVKISGYTVVDVAIGYRTQREIRDLRKGGYVHRNETLAKTELEELNKSIPFS